jgi:hypothetical protein
LGGVLDFSASRHSGRLSKKGVAWSRSRCQKAAASVRTSPPSLACAACTADAAPDSRSVSRPACHDVADSGNGCPAHWFIFRMAAASSSSYCSVVSTAGFGSTLSETSVIRPSVPSAPTISRDTS